MGRLAFLSVTLLMLVSREASAQDTQRPPDTISLSGPRAGVTFLSQGVRNQIEEDFSQDLGPVISQFGWQFEKRFMSSENRRHGRDGVGAALRRSRSRRLHAEPHLAPRMADRGRH